MQVEQVDFVSLPARDAARAVDWYRRVLALPESEFHRRYVAREKRGQG